MATSDAAAKNPEPPVSSPLNNVIRAIKNVPRNAQAGLLTAVLLVIVALAGLRDLEDVDPGQIVLLGMACAAILLASLKKDAIPSVVLLLVFVILGVGIHLVQPEAVTATPLAGDSANLQPRQIFGRVQDVTTRTGIKGVVVRAVETNAIDISDADGDFDLNVPQVKASGDSIQVNMVYGSRFDSTFWQRLEGNRLKVSIPQPPLAAVPAQAAGSASTIGRSRMVPLMMNANTTRPQVSPLIIILDSIRAVRDGTGGDANWSFDVEMNGQDVLEVARRPYNDEGDSRLVYVGAETAAEVNRAKTTLGINGTRKKLIGFHRIRGERVIDVNHIPANTPLPIEITVRPAGSSGGAPSAKGHFQFYFTLLRTVAPQTGS